MKRFFLLCLTAALTLLAVVPLSAQANAGDPRTLAQYLPADTVAYVSIRTDQAYLETINDVISTLAAAAGETLPPGGLLGFLSDQIARESNGALTYETAIGAWLGNSAALALVDMQQMMAGDSPLLLVEVADAPALRDLLGQLFAGSSQYTVEEGDGFTYYIHSSRFSESLLLTDDLLYVSRASVIDSLFNERSAERLAAGFGAAALAVSPRFIAAYDALPAAGYNLFGYLDGAALVATLASAGATPFPVDFALLQAAVNVQSFGGTLLDDRTFALDLALVHGDALITDALGLPALPDFTLAPVNLDFASVAPVDSFAFTAGTSSGTGALIAFDYLETLAPVLADLAQDVDAEAAFNLRAGLPTILNVVRGFFTDLFGVPFADLMAMLDGQTASFMRISNETGSFDFAQVYENLRPDLNASVLSGVESLLTRFAVPFDSADGRINIDLAAMTETLEDLNRGRRGSNMEMFGLLFGADMDRISLALSPEYLLSGTPEAVGFVLGGSRIARLNSTPAFQHEAQFFLPGANQIWFLALAPLLEAFPSSEMQGAAAFDSFGISTAPGDGASLMRMTMTFKAE